MFRSLDLMQLNISYRGITNVPHHLVRHSTGIFAHYTANFVITTLFSTAYEGRGTYKLGVILTAGQPNPVRYYESVKYCYFTVSAVPVADYGILYTRSNRCSVITKLLSYEGVALDGGGLKRDQSAS